MPPHVRKAVIPAAGSGTRLMPLTRLTPKELLPLGLEPMLHYSLVEAAASGIERVCLVISPAKHKIRDYLSGLGNEAYFPLKISYAYQPQPWGVADAIYRARRFVGQEPFCVLMPDNVFISPTPALKQLILVYNRYRTNIVGLTRVDKVEAGFFANCGRVRGRLLEPGLWRLTQLADKKPGRFTVKGDKPSLRGLGRQLFLPDIFEYIDRLRPVNDSELDDVPVLKEMINNQELIGCLLPGKALDAGHPEGYIRAFAICSSVRKEKLWGKPSLGKTL